MLGTLILAVVLGVGVGLLGKVIINILSKTKANGKYSTNDPLTSNNTTKDYWSCTSCGYKNDNNVHNCRSCGKDK